VPVVQVLDPDAGGCGLMVLQQERGGVHAAESACQEDVLLPGGGRSEVLQADGLEEDGGEGKAHEQIFRAGSHQDGHEKDEPGRHKTHVQSFPRPRKEGVNKPAPMDVAVDVRADEEDAEGGQDSLTMGEKQTPMRGLMQAAMKKLVGESLMVKH
jgi:hypothetical protein